MENLLVLIHREMIQRFHNHPIPPIPYDSLCLARETHPCISPPQISLSTLLSDVAAFDVVSRKRLQGLMGSVEERKLGHELGHDDQP